MDEQKLNGYQFFKMFSAGVSAVVSRKEHLNSINVFPVMDGDTGTNLLMTLTSTMDETIISSDFSIVINSMSNAAITSARGNSGVIFASFLSGISKAFGHLKEVTIEEFGVGIVKASEEAYHSVSKPVEGTMLTVIRVWTEFINNEYMHYFTFNDLFNNAYEKAIVALEETPKHLDVLQKYQVVDSGAKGFVFFLEGINACSDDFSTMATSMLHEYEVIDFKVDEANEIHKVFETEKVTNRYCCEFTISGEFSQKELLNDIGDAIVITGNQRVSKIHIHANNPMNVMSLIVDANYQVTKAKVDDMVMQVNVKQHSMAKIGILTDSICDLPQSVIEKWQIHMISLNVHADGQTYLDKQTINTAGLAPLLEEQAYPKSSQTDVQQIRLKLDWMLMHYESVIIISVSSKLSGMYNNYHRAIETMDCKSKKVSLIDSKLNSGAQGLLVLRAAELANAGYSHDEIVHSIDALIQKIRIYVSLDTFKYAVKSGRVPNTIGKLGMILNVKPIMTLNEIGEGTAFGMAFSRKQINKKIMKLIKKISKEEEITDYAIVHASNISEANQYSEVFSELLGFAPKFITEISAITTIHAGKGAVAIAILKGHNKNG